MQFYFNPVRQIVKWHTDWGDFECIYVCDMGSLPSRANPIKLGGLGAA